VRIDHQEEQIGRNDMKVGNNPAIFPRKPVLSLILCTRNDQYMGNSRWRLQTTLNYVAQRVHELSRDPDVEVLVADWGSEIPIRSVLELSPAAAGIVSFIQIPPEIARDLQKDSPFAEVFALNAAARRANGEYIGRIDQDTLLGKDFLEYFFALYEGRQRLEVPLESALLFANQRMVPYRFTVRCPSFWAVDKYINWFGHNMKVEVTSTGTFYKHGVGIWLIHRNLWSECGGYDEQMIYMNLMEVNMISRLLTKYQVVNLGQLVNYVFFHLEHYHPLTLRRSSTHRKVNPRHLFSNYEIMNPNGPDWGMARYPLEILPYPLAKDAEKAPASSLPPFRWLSFMAIIVLAGVQVTGDALIKSLRKLPTGSDIAWFKLVEPFRRSYNAWAQRFRIAQETVNHQPLSKWPKLLAILWNQKRAQRLERQKSTQ